jgi:hypothetical protein
MKYLEFSNRFIITIKDITSTREAVEVQKTFISIPFPPGINLTLATEVFLLPVPLY